MLELKVHTNSAYKHRGEGLIGVSEHKAGLTNGCGEDQMMWDTYAKSLNIYMCSKIALILM